MSDFVMPALGADMESGTLLQWYVKSGDAVKRGDIVALVDTNKAEIEVEIFEDGIIDELVVAEGQRVPVGTVLATLRPAGVEAAAAVPPKRRGAVAPAEAAPRAPTEVRAVAAPAAAHNGHRLRISPVARRAAEQLGVDVSALAGTGPEGAITKADVEQAA